MKLHETVLCHYTCIWYLG